MAASPKNPSTLIFWNDLENDEHLKTCSLAAKGLWDHHLLPMAARSAEPGVIILGDHASRVDDDLPLLLARAVGESPDTIAGLLRELVSSRAASVDAKGRLFNRRMVREEAISKARSKAGKRGAEATNAERQKSGKHPGKRGGKSDGKPSGNDTGKPSGKNGGGESSVNTGDERTIQNGADEHKRQNLSKDAGKDDGQPSDDTHGKSPPSSLFKLQASSSVTTTESLIEASPPGSSTPAGSGADAPHPDDDDLAIPLKLDRSAEAKLVALWNAAADTVNAELGHIEWAKVAKLSAERKRKAKALLRSHSLDEVERALQRAMTDRWALGQTQRPAEHADWRFNFDHFIKEKTVTKFAEMPDDEPHRDAPKSALARNRQALAEWSREGSG